MWDNPFVHCEYVLLSLVNRKARQNEARWESQPENAGEKKGTVRETVGKQDGRGLVKSLVTWCMQINTDLGYPDSVFQCSFVTFIQQQENKRAQPSLLQRTGGDVS